MTCAKAQEFLAREKIESITQVNAKKIALKEREALEIISQVDEVYATKGKKVIHLDLRKEQPDKATLKGILLGPTGNLRAPTLRIGRQLVVGFDHETYQKVFRV
jgi:arsenate reductase-like glutaredoxin family protein